MAEQIPMASSAFSEFGRIYGVMDEPGNLKTTLESIQIVLSEAEQRQYQDPVIEHWIRRFNEVLHDADDLLDDLAIKDLRRKVNGHSKVVSKPDIIGREENKKEIIDLLKQTHNNQNVSLFAIAGMGGLGKRTALAQSVYNDAEVQKLLWVCVSEDFEVKTLLHKTLESLNGYANGHLQLDQLQKKLQEELNG